MTSKQVIEKYLALADIQIDGKRPSDIKVHNPQLYARVLAGGSLALGESYMDGWWDCKRLDGFIHKILKARLDKKVRNASMVLNVVKAKLINMQSRSRAHEIGKRHYDIGNDLYEVMLDERMTYSCGYWKHTETLDQAQERKLDLCCKKLGLKKGMKVLDIGCGWGSFIKYAAEEYKVNVVGITVSIEQVKLARQRCQGLPIEIRLQDYRKLHETFDRIISIGMFEHVGSRNYRTYMGVVHRCLRPDGLFLLHTIGGNKSVSSSDPWIDKYIFPNSMLPSAKQIASAAEGLFVLEDWHSFGMDYDKTIMAWHSNFVRNWKNIKNDYDSRFYRMWRYYLLSCAGSFRARKNQLWQIVLSKKGIEGGFRTIR